MTGDSSCTQEALRFLMARERDGRTRIPPRACHAAIPPLFGDRSRTSFARESLRAVRGSWCKPDVPRGRSDARFGGTRRTPSPGRPSAAHGGSCSSRDQGSARRAGSDGSSRSRRAAPPVDGASRGGSSHRLDAPRSWRPGRDAPSGNPRTCHAPLACRARNGAVCDIGCRRRPRDLPGPSSRIGDSCCSSSPSGRRLDRWGVGRGRCGRARRRSCSGGRGARLRDTSRTPIQTWLLRHAVSDSSCTGCARGSVRPRARSDVRGKRGTCSWRRRIRAAGDTRCTPGARRRTAPSPG